MKDDICDFILFFVVGLIICGLIIVGWKFIIMVVIPMIKTITIPRSIILWLGCSFVFAIFMFAVTKDVREELRLNDKNN